MKFWGGSFVANAQGKLLYLASHDQEEVVVTELDLSQTDYFRKHCFSLERRIDSYQLLLKDL
jgi:N-carbamoylputrescine amidase